MLNEKQRNLVMENEKLIYYTLNKLGLNNEDYYDVAAIGLCLAAEAYDETTKFSTFAIKCITNGLFRQMKKNQMENDHRDLHYFNMNKNPNKKEKEIEDIPDITNDYIESMEDSIVASNAYEKTISNIEAKDSCIYRMYLAGMKQKEICERAQVNQPIVSRSIQRVNKKIKKAAKIEEIKRQKSRFRVGSQRRGIC